MLAERRSDTDTQLELWSLETGELEGRLDIAGSPAHNLTIYDALPNQADGGLCDAAPTGVTAQVFEADGTTAVSPLLADGTDFTVAFAGDPDCRLSITTLTPAAAIGADLPIDEPVGNMVIDIGGQDSKVLKLDADGTVLDFIMNDRCAAGTGRFLEAIGHHPADEDREREAAAELHRLLDGKDEAPP